MAPPPLPSAPQQHRAYASIPTPSSNGIVSTPGPITLQSLNNARNAPTPAATPGSNAAGKRNANAAVSGGEGAVEEEVVPSVPEINSVQGIVPALQ